MTTQIQKQKKSFKHIFEWAEKQFYELADLFTKKKSEIILETARRLEKEGCEQSKISNEIITNLSGYVDDSYVRKILKDYPQYKDQKQQANAKFGRNIPAKPAQQDDRKPLEVPADKVSVTPNQQEELVDVAEVAANVLTLPENQKADSNTQMQQTSRSLSGQPQTKGVQGIHNIAPEDYELDHLHEYDRDLLARIVIWLDTNSSDLSKLVTRTSEEVVELRKQVEEAKPFLELLSLLPPVERKSWLEITEHKLQLEKNPRGLKK